MTKKIIWFVLGSAAGMVTGYFIDRNLPESNLPSELRMREIIPKLNKDLNETSKRTPWERIVELSKNKIVIGGIIGGTVGLGASFALPYLGAAILPYLKATPSGIPTVPMNIMMDEINRRHLLVGDAALKLVKDPNLEPEDIIGLLKTQVKEVKKMADGDNKSKALLTVLTLITFILMYNISVFKPLIGLLSDLLKDRELSKLINPNLKKIIVELIKKNNNSTNPDF